MNQDKDPAVLTKLKTYPHGYPHDYTFIFNNLRGLSGEKEPYYYYFSYFLKKIFKKNKKKESS